MTDLAAARSAAAHRLDALYERAETAKANHDAGRRILQDLMDELAALAAARLALQQELADVIGKLERTEAALWKESEHRNTVVERLHAAEAAVTALRQDLQALPRYKLPFGEYIKARDLADRLAKDVKS